MQIDKKNAIGFLFGFCSPLALLYVLYSDNSWFQPTNPSLPRRSLLAVLLVAFFAALHWYSGARNRRKIQHLAEAQKKSRPKLRRPIANMGTCMLAMQLILAGWIFILANHGGWTAYSVGFQSEWPVWGSLSAGFGAYGIFAMMVAMVIKKLGIYEAVLDNNMQVMAYLWPRSRAQRLYLVIGMCLLNPVTEELLFRGILVHQLGLMIGSPALPIALGLVASLGNHAYQGRLAMTTHLPFYVIVVGLLFSPAGLWGAIGFHFAGDFFPIVQLQQSLKAYRSRHGHLVEQSSGNQS